MEYAKIGNTDIEVSKLCIGCMSFGKAGTMHDWTLDAQESEKVIKHALNLGINFFDTPIEETMEALDGLVKAGKVRAIGASAMYGHQFYNMQLAAEDVAYLEERYVPHPVVGAIKENPAQGVVLSDEKK